MKFDRSKEQLLDFESINVGDTRELAHAITEKDIEQFSQLTGDLNPLHLDEDFARKTLFRRPVVYGMLTASFISTVIGMAIPGPGALWLSQTLKFSRQAYEGDVIRVVVKVKQKSKATRILVLETIIYNQRHEELVTGEAQVRLLELNKEKKAMGENKMTILVTGASRGIGAAIARRLALDGDKVVVNYSRGEADALQVVKEIKAEGGEAMAFKADVSKKGEVEKMCARASEKMGPIQAVVHNASGPVGLKPFQDMTWESIQAHLDVQVKGAFNCLQAVLLDMLEKGNGSIVIIGSVATDSVPPSHQTGYVVSKAALGAFARSLAVEYGPKNIRVNVVAPGMTETDMILELPQKAKELARMYTPLRKLAQPEDIAHVVSFLLRPGSGHITGETIRVCGGSVML